MNVFDLTAAVVFAVVVAVVAVAAVDVVVVVVVGLMTFAFARDLN